MEDSLELPSIVVVAFVDVVHTQKKRAANGYKLRAVLMIGAPAASGVECEERREELRMRLSER